MKHAIFFILSIPAIMLWLVISIVIGMIFGIFIGVAAWNVSVNTLIESAKERKANGKAL